MPLSTNMVNSVTFKSRTYSPSVVTKGNPLYYIISRCLTFVRVKSSSWTAVYTSAYFVCSVFTVTKDCGLVVGTALPRHEKIAIFSFYRVPKNCKQVRGLGTGKIRRRTFFTFSAKRLRILKVHKKLTADSQDQYD